MTACKHKNWLFQNNREFMGKLSAQADSFFVCEKNKKACLFMSHAD
jgi:hypothetical protein